MKYFFNILLVITFLVSVLYSQNQYILEFDGQDDYVKYSDDATLGKLDGATDYTIEAWIYPTTFQAYDRILQRYYSFSLSLYGTNAIRFAVSKGGGTWNNYYTQDNVIEEDAWNHVAVICNSSNGTLKIFVNGVDVSSSSYSDDPLRSSVDNDNFYVGQRGDGGYFFEGFIDEVRCKNVAVDPSSLHYHKNDPPYTSDANTAILFHFDEGSGSYTENAASGVDARLGGVSTGDDAEPTWRPWNYNGSDLSLPVELTLFTAAVENSTVHLHWVTESEVNNQGFEILRSTRKDGQYLRIADYTTHPELQGQGNSTVRHEYEFTDRSVTVGYTYWYKLVDVDYSGKRTFHGPIAATLSGRNLTTLSSNIPGTLRLYPNYPNPFNPSTTLKFDVPLITEGPTEVSLVVYNSLGQQIATLYQGVLNAGTYQLQWNGKDITGNSIPGGIYFAVLKTPFNTRTVKMVLLK